MNTKQFTIFILAVVGFFVTTNASATTLPSDYTGNQKVNLADFAVLASHWKDSVGDKDKLDRLAFHWMMDATVNTAISVQTIYTDKSRYAPRETSAITVICKNNSSQSYRGRVCLNITHQGHSVHTDRQSISLAVSQTVSKTFSWTSPTTDFEGYLVEAWLDNGSCAVTAVDVSSDWKRYPRYGYVTEFYSSTTSSRNTTIINNLSRNYHINSLQYYDWMWRHEQVIERNAGGVIVDPWTDWRGAAISYGILRDSIYKAHAKSIAAMPYFQIYLGLDDYETVSSVSPEWGLYSDTNHANQYKHDADVNMWVFDPGNTNWQDHLCSEYTDALTTMDWDGIHLDQLGNIGNGVYYNYDGGTVVLEDALVSMVDRTKDHLDYLETIDSDVVGRDAFMFNLVDGAVGNWAVDEILASKSDIIYSELWINTTYQGVCDFIKYAKVNSGKKPVVLAAYINRYEDTGGVFDTDSVLLADAAFFASGAFHIELGDGEYMLAQEFFPARDKTMSSDLLSRLCNYYNFITAYEQLLFATDLRLGNGGLQWISADGYTLSGDATGNTIWFLNRATAQFEIFHLINLSGNDTLWRNIAETPSTIENIALTLRLGPDVAITGVYIASPDIAGGIMQPVAYTAAKDSRGNYISLTVPQLTYWDMIYVERTITAPTNNRYEAENAILWNTAINTNHSGYSGSGFVDQFADVNDSVSFYVTIPQAGNYTFLCRYANGGTSATRSLIIDGDVIGNFTCAALGSWDTWANATQTTYLTAGVYQVCLYYGSWNNGAINFDYLQVQ